MTTSLEKHKIEHIQLGENSNISHSNLLNLSSNDHPQYLLIIDIDDSPVNGEITAPISSNWAYDHLAAADPHTGYRLESADHTHQSSGAQAGQLDHGLALTGLSDDDHSIYALLAGRSGGQTFKGGTDSGDDLTLQSTNHATKGSILFGTSAYDEVNNRLGIGTASPDSHLHILSSSASGNVPFIHLENDSAATPGTFGPGIIFENNVAGKHGFIINQYQSSMSEFAVSNYSSPYTQYFIIDQDGNVGIGKSPSYKLDIDLSTADLGISDATNTGTAGTYTEDGYITVDIGGSTRYIRVYDLT